MEIAIFVTSLAITVIDNRPRTGEHFIKDESSYKAKPPLSGTDSGGCFRGNE